MAQAVAAAPRCLVVEDEVLIGMFLEDGLGKAGFDVRWVASTRDALDMLAVAPFDLAVLDVILRSEACVPLARELERRCIPFLVYSGHSRDDGLTAFRNAPWLEKPVDTRVLVTALAGLLNSPDASVPDRAEKAFRGPRAASTKAGSQPASPARPARSMTCRTVSSPSAEPP